MSPILLEKNTIIKEDNMENLQTLKDKLFIQRNAANIAPYRSAIDLYMKTIQKSPDHHNNLSYLFHIFKNVAAIHMSVHKPDKSILREIQSCLPFNLNDSSISSFVDFNNLNMKLSSYLHFHTDLKEQSMPKPYDHHDIYEEWEDQWWELKESGTEILQKAMNLTLTQEGFCLVYNTETPNISFSKTWHQFVSQSKDFLERIYKNEHAFYMWSNDVLKILSRYPYLSNNIYQECLNRISQPGKTYAKEQAYRKFFSSDKANEIFNDTQEKLPQHAPAAHLHFYRCSLAANMLIDFVLNRYFANNNRIVKNIEIDIELDENVPVLKTGNQKCSIHCLNKPHLNSWGIRKDLLLSQMDTDSYEGALFCFIKQYPNGTELACFENFVPKDQLIALINAQAEVYKNFVRLPYEDIYAQDLRENFLEAAVTQLTDYRKVIHTLAKCLSFSKDRERFNLNILEKIILPLSVYYYIKQNKHVRVSQSSDEIVPPPTYTLLVPEVFNHLWDKEFDFFDVNDKFVDKLVEYALDQDDYWHYYIRFMDAEGRVLFEEMDEVDEELELIVPQKTIVVMLAMGTEADIHELQKDIESNDLTEEKESNIFWVIYGPGKGD